MNLPNYSIKGLILLCVRPLGQCTGRFSIILYITWRGLSFFECSRLLSKELWDRLALGDLAAEQARDPLPQLGHCRLAPAQVHGDLATLGAACDHECYNRRVRLVA